MSDDPDAYRLSADRWSADVEESDFSNGYQPVVELPPNLLHELGWPAAGAFCRVIMTVEPGGRLVLTQAISPLDDDMAPR